MTIDTGAVTTLPVAEATTSDQRPNRARMFVVLVAIVLGGVGNLVATLFALPDGDVTLDWAAKHQSAWAAGLYGNALLGLGLVALLIAVCVLARRRGAAWATVSLAIGTLGTFLWVVAAAGVPMGYLAMGTQTVVSSAQASSLVDYMSRHDMSQGAVAFPRSCCCSSPRSPSALR
jgi:hypothetical protein